MITVIINPISGAARGAAADRVDLARAALGHLDEEVDIAVSTRRGHVRELAAAAVAAGARLLFAWGGDGTINEAGSALLGRDAALAMIPSGSGNGLARELGVPMTPEAAIARALHARPRVIDAGELGGRPFFNIGGVGLDAHIASCFDRSGSRGLAGYIRVSARELLAYRSASYRIAAGEQCSADSGPPATRRALLVTLANSPQYGNRARIAPRARLDDGLLDLIVYEEVSRFTTLCALPRLFGGAVERIRGFSTQQVDRARIESDLPMTFHVDGEPVGGGTVLEARVLPRALRVCA